MKLIIVRHEETEGNTQGIVQGQSPTSLNDAGRMQSQKAATRLRSEPIGAVYSSDLPRARETAESIAAEHGLPVHVTVELRERNYGIYSGRPRAELQAAVKNLGTTFEAYRPPKGENVSDVQDRARRFLKSIERKHKNQTVVIVSHGQFIRCLLALLVRTPLEKDRLHLPNTSVTVVEKQGENWVLHTLASVEHLD